MERISWGRGTFHWGRVYWNEVAENLPFINPVASAAPAENSRGIMTPYETFDCYADLFGYYPFFVYWRGSHEELQALCQKAIDRGSELTDEEIFEAQGLEMPPPGSPHPGPRA